MWTFGENVVSEFGIFDESGVETRDHATDPKWFRRVYFKTLEHIWLQVLTLANPVGAVALTSPPAGSEYN